ncbi:MAG: lytic transglycosylase F [Gammaproteobacteria bacterium]
MLGTNRSVDNRQAEAAGFRSRSSTHTGRGAVIGTALVLSTILLPPVWGEEPASIPEAALNEPWTGDFDGMAERHRIRALVAYSKTFYFGDRGHQRGLTYELLKAFEKDINARLKKRTLKVELVVIPTPRDQLIPGLIEGRGDIAASNLTITPERQALVDFSDPFLTGVNEIVVTGAKGPALATIEDLAGKQIYVRESSSYFQSLQQLNETFKKAGKPEIDIVLADELLEDEDLLEMVNASLIPAIVIDSYKGEFWAQIFDNIKLHPEITVRTGGQIGWAFRKDSPKLQEVINAFVKKNKKGSLLGNMLLKRYLKNTKYVRNALTDKEREKFNAMIALFQAYSGKYGFDWLIIGALAYQESGLDQSKRSHAGAIGVMQMLPSTAKDPNVNIPNIEELEPNIHAGVKYLHFLKNRYFQDDSIDELDQWLFTFAAYNAGPAKITRLRKEAPKMGLDPNKWFRNVEIVAAKRIGRETVRYVSNIYKYYIAYQLIAKQRKKQKATVKTTAE